MKKNTLKHMQPNGTVATRQTARAYTHVLLGKRNNAIAAAALVAVSESMIAAAIKGARRNFKDHETQIAAGVGGLVPYTRDQGGYRKLADGSLASHVQDQWQYDSAVKWHAEYGGTLENYIAHAAETTSAYIKMSLASIAARSEEWYVVSWHGSAKNAKPSYVGAGDAFMVEPINGGVRE